MKKPALDTPRKNSWYAELPTFVKSLKDKAYNDRFKSVQELRGGVKLCVSTKLQSL